MHQSKQDFCSGLALLGLALVLYFYLIPTWVGDTTFGAMSPRFFPRFGTILIGLGGIALMFGALLTRKSEVEIGDTPLKDKTGLLKVFLIAVAMVGFILLFQWFGYLYAAPPLIASLMLVFGGRNPLAIVLVSTATTAVLFIVFSYGLNLPLV